MCFYSAIHGAKSELVWKSDELDDAYYGRYKGLDVIPPDGWDEVRVPFTGHQHDWKQYREGCLRSNNARKQKSHDEIQCENTPWRTPEGDCEYSIKKWMSSEKKYWTAPTTLPK